MDAPTLASLELVPYISDRGLLPQQFQSKVGVYAIFDEATILQYIGYSRDVYQSLKQHLVRQPTRCYWLKVQTVEHPNRTILDTIRSAWIAENGTLPPGNQPNETSWTEAINVKQQMTPEEQEHYSLAVDEITQIKVLKQVARRLEAEVLAILQNRGVQEDLRFNPKMKEAGLLDLK
ncbi:MAG: GIY-YIG nuclease family protein [Oscillatoriales cyanobacterium C42_A2020_001]|nr:GIY-YIG nuclease family protein [Leptolyngbyaceae cyanobacterium C42_A2020_001]